MSDMEARLVRLRRKLEQETDPEERADLEAAIAALEEKLAVAAQSITDHAQVGVAIAGGVRGTVTNVTGDVTGSLLSGIFHGAVYLDGRRADQAVRLLGEYMDRLRGRCGSITLEGLHQHKQLGDGDSVSLQQVYTQLTIAGIATREVYRGAELQALDLAAFIQEHTADTLLPAQRRIDLLRPMTAAEQQERRQRGEFVENPGQPPTERMLNESLAQLNTDALRALLPQIDQITFRGPMLVTDAIASTRHLVLLGEPGSGKSTALRYLALTLAEAGLDPARDPVAMLTGWGALEPDQRRLLPLFVPLLPFARRLAADSTMLGSADELWNFLADHVESGNLRSGLAEAVHAEIVAGRALLLLDGLD
ncbi:MAG: hypothetical protein SH847_27515, partial [Roseiflexaceae bacterium]|nr:hypothetical protein [Roseiflexaceae bacterium]